MLKGKNIGCIGVGNMGRAMIEGLLQAKVVQESHVWLADRSAEKLRELTDEWDVHTGSNREVAEASDILILAIKPQDMLQLLEEIADTTSKDTLMISIAAGIPTEVIESALPPAVPVVRVMPNLPAMIGAGASAYSLGSHASWPHGVVCSLICSAIGISVEVSEDQMDAVTALSGTGPAYVFLLAEVLTEAGALEGLPREVASYLATQTILGGAKMIAQSDLSPATLRQQVTSPNGTTAAAMNVFEQDGFRELFYKGVKAARQRSAELSRSHRNN
ncbi:MAG: pyrroline-5-carboxylate reductase [Myxococcales bacterium]|nr:pyrroline-5-carboxylate reductase [Myxococcales bacterium]